MTRSSAAAAAAAAAAPRPSKRRKVWNAMMTAQQQQQQQQSSSPQSSQVPTIASTAHMTLHHQDTILHFGLVLSSNDHSGDESSSSSSSWCAWGVTTLYLSIPSNDAANSNNTATTSSQLPLPQLALHLRSSCTVESVDCYTVVAANGTKGTAASQTKLAQMVEQPCSFAQVDPLQHVLVRSASLEEPQPKNNNNGSQSSDSSFTYRFNADAQSSRGAVGMTTGLRAASMASNLGELRIALDQHPPPITSALATASMEASSSTIEALKTEWRRDLEESSSHQNSTSAGDVAARLSQRLQQRAEERRRLRLDLIAQRLASGSTGGGGATKQQSSSNTATDAADAKQSSPPKKPAMETRSYKVVIRYRISGLERQAIARLAGLQAVAGGGGLMPTPHVYTVMGTYGDHEGPRCWLPVLDSAAPHHRATHTLCIKVTAPVAVGLSIVGGGEDFGVTETLLHDATSNELAVVAELGTSSSSSSSPGVAADDFVRARVLGGRTAAGSSMATSASSTGGNHPHVIPPEQPPQKQRLVSLDTIFATSVWCGQTWTPIPSRSLGFAIGPFKVLEDPEYFGPNALDGDDDDDDEEDMNGFEDRLTALLEKTRSRGEGIRQVYFAPLFERKYIHTRASTSVNRSLLPNTTLRLLPLSPHQQTTAEQLDETVTIATTGVPLRALSLMRDVLAVPSIRTHSYTQIWIPNALHGGCTSGALHHCPEVLVNPFLGGAILDSCLLPPVGARLPYFQGGRALQFLQARCAVRGWIIAALPLGGQDDVGTGYLLTLFESLIMSLYERGHGGQGEGGANGGCFYSKRYAALSGLNSSNLDFMPVQNFDDEVVVGGVGAVPVEERHNEHLWRGAMNGSESHSSAIDEFNSRQLLCKDGVEALERGVDRDKGVPSPSMGWFGSYLSLSFLSSNATSSSDIGCGAVDMLHQIGGLVYRAMKCETFRAVVEARAGVANFIRLMRVAFIAAHLNDIGEKELKLPKRKKKHADAAAPPAEAGGVAPTEDQDDVSAPSQPFVVCVNEILKKNGLTHTLFTRALQNLSGRIKEPQLLGTLVDAERHAEDPRTRRPFVDPEGFPNSYVRGASHLFCRVGVQVEAARDSSSQGQASAPKGIQMQAYAEPVIPDGGIAFGGPITVRVVENEGSFREYVKDLSADGSRRDWGATFLHAKPVTSAKAQTAASGAIEASTTTKETSKPLGVKLSTLDELAVGGAFTDTDFHTGGYQAIELIRLTNLTPLLWVRVDPAGLYGGRISVVQPDACLAEQLFHDGDASAQIEAIRALAERPLRIQASGKFAPTHTPAVRAQAALSIAQWQNNKAPQTKDAVGAENWVGINILIQYFRERFYSSAMVMPVKFFRLVLKKNDEEARQANTAADGGLAPSLPSFDSTYEYLDTLDEDEMKEALEAADSVEVEEDEEYRVRSVVVAAVSSIRAKDGYTPPLAIQFLETVLESEDAEMAGNLVYDSEQLFIEDTFRKANARFGNEAAKSEESEKKSGPSLTYVSSQLVADALLAICQINSTPMTITDSTGKIASKGPHPLMRLLRAASSWLEWELYRESIRLELEKDVQCGISGNSQNVIAACAVLALSNVAILIQSTTDDGALAESNNSSVASTLKDATSAKFYTDIFDSYPHRNDLTRAACAQALSCICCAADRLEKENSEPVGLLTAFEFLLDRILDVQTSVSLRHTLALIMMDSCTGKICSMQRVGAIAGRNDLVTSLARFFCGPLGACHGGDNGSAILMAVSAATFPAASAVNDGARRGMRLLSRAGHPSSTQAYKEVVRVALFATRLWRTINGEPADAPKHSGDRLVGVCAYDGVLRCSLLALWQWLWPKGCYALLQVQSWGNNTDVGGGSTAHHFVMTISEKEKAAATAEENSLADINRLVENERDRQVWRGEMVQKAYDMQKANNAANGNKGSSSSTPSTSDLGAAEKGIGQPLPPIARDTAFRQGGWIASAAQQRRALFLDGGTAVTKLRLIKAKNTAES